MTSSTTEQAAVRLRQALAAPAPSMRLQAALAVGTRPDPAHVPALVGRCAVEPDGYVRDALTWALVRHDPAATVPLLLAEVESRAPQARSQALHTLSKTGDPRGWSAITSVVLCDPDDEVARSAWRAALVLVPQGDRTWLAGVLATQLGRGSRDVRLSLSRALVALGDGAESALAEAAAAEDVETRTHALATQHLLHHPDTGLAASLAEAERIVALGRTPLPAGSLPRADR